MGTRKGMNIVSDSRRASARKHATRTFTCSCGKVARGNGGWSSHRKACTAKRFNVPPAVADGML